MATAVREEVRFRSGAGECAAWWYPGEDADAPAIVLGHGLGGVREGGLEPFAEGFVRAGYGALVFDYRHFGASTGEPRQLVSVKRQLEDWESAIRWVRARSVARPARVVLHGTSYGGGHALSTAARDPDLAAVIVQIPFVDGVSASRATPFAQSLRLTAAGLRDAARSRLHRPRRYIPIVGEPGALAAITSPGAVGGYRAMFPDSDPSQDVVTAASLLELPRYRPGRRARRIACPTLLCVADHDTVTPPAPALKAARRIPQGELCTYPVDHFDIYVGAAFERALADQLDFLERVLRRPGD
jgi:pimeloyl-ACP methyl ester carboxylesterase